MISAGGSKSSSKSDSFQFRYRPIEEELQGLNMDIVRQQIDSIMQQMDFQQRAFDSLGPTFDQMQMDAQVQNDLFTPEERRQQALDTQGRLDSVYAAQDELRASELERIRQGPGATDEQRGLINQATEAQIARGEADISRFGQSALNMIAQELAPGKGLRPTDTPIQDRGFRVGEEMMNQQGQLVSSLRGQQAQAELNFPLAANQSQAGMAQFQQQLGQSATDFQQQLAQQAQQNRQNLFGQTGQLGLGLVTGTQPQAALQQSFQPLVGQSSESSAVGWNAGVGSSSRALKAGNHPIDEAAVLDALLSIPVEGWHYIFPGKGEHGEHIGTYAEDFTEAFGIGDGTTINYLDAIGVCMAAIQTLSKRVKQLEGGS